MTVACVICGETASEDHWYAPLVVRQVGLLEFENVPIPEQRRVFFCNDHWGNFVADQDPVTGEDRYRVLNP